MRRHRSLIARPLCASRLSCGGPLQHVRLAVCLFTCAMIAGVRLQLHVALELLVLWRAAHAQQRRYRRLHVSNLQRTICEYRNSKGLARLIPAPRSLYSLARNRPQIRNQSILRLATCVAWTGMNGTVPSQHTFCPN
jgi:hypothetical protein